jgi:hypothetical protein
MFSNNFVVSIKSNNKFFREEGNSIRIPFGSEYSLYMKNLDSRRAVLTVRIDGKDVLDGRKLIVNGKSVLELEGFMDGNTAKNRFKFIERTKAIEDYRGVTPEDRIIEVEFDFEEPYVYYMPITWYEYTYKPYDYGRPYSPYRVTTIGGTSTGTSGRITYVFTNNSINQSALSFNLFPENDNGITVEGNDISQQFQSTHVGQMENSPTTISFKLFGFKETEENKVAVFTSDRIECKTCGLKSKSINKFCGRCGTRLNYE